MIWFERIVITYPVERELVPSYRTHGIDREEASLGGAVLSASLWKEVGGKTLDRN